MANKLDDRYVEYDLVNSINVLPVEHGGTGVGAYPNANRILMTKATGIPASPISIEDSGWGIGSMGALSSWDANKGPFEARIQTGETHIANVSLHLPSGGSNVTFLRGDNTWQAISTTADLVYCDDNFTQSNSTNVQNVLEDLDSKLRNIVQPGLILPFAFASAPNGFLICDGSEVSRTTYIDLFNYIGELYGSGDGNTTFNIPDLRGQFIRGWDGTAGIDPGRVFGSNQDDELESHAHPLTPGYQDGSGTNQTGSADSTNDAIIITTTDSFGGSETRPKNVALLYCIKY